MDAMSLLPIKKDTANASLKLKISNSKDARLAWKHSRPVSAFEPDQKTASYCGLKKKNKKKTKKNKNEFKIIHPIFAF